MDYSPWHRKRVRYDLVTNQQQTTTIFFHIICGNELRNKEKSLFPRERQYYASTFNIKKKKKAQPLTGNPLCIDELGSPLCCCCVVLGHVQLFATLWTVALQAPPSMEFFRQEYWSRLSFPTPGDLSDPGIKPRLCVPCNGRWMLSLGHPGNPR